jgi:hypothetical protein
MAGSGQYRVLTGPRAHLCGILSPALDRHTRCPQHGITNLGDVFDPVALGLDSRLDGGDILVDDEGNGLLPAPTREPALRIAARAHYATSIYRWSYSHSGNSRTNRGD